MGRVLGGHSGLVGRAVASWPLAAGIVASVPALVLYWRTLMPGVGFWDTAEFQAIGPVLGIAHPTGYPAYTLLAWLASVVFQPFGNEALRANLLSAIVTAAAVGVTAATVTRLTGRFAVGVVTGVALAVSAETWAIGLRADPHSLHLLMASTLLLLLVVWQDRLPHRVRADRWLIGAAATYGLSLGNHGLTFLLAPGIGLFVLAAYPAILRRFRLMATCVAALALTTVAVYLYLPIRSAMNPPLDYANPQTWDGFRYLVFAEQFRGTFQALPHLADAVRTIGSYTVEQLGVFALLALVGVIAAAWRRPHVLLLLVAWFGVNWYFALGYVNADIGRYYLVPLLAVAVLGGFGAAAILDGLILLVARIGQTRSWWTARAERLSAIVMSTVLAALLVRASDVGAQARYQGIDASRDEVARRWLDGVMGRLENDAVVVSWWSYSTTLWYGLYVDGLRPDITVVDDSTIVGEKLGSAIAVIDSYLGRRPVYVIRLSSDIPGLEARYVLTQVPGIVGGPVYRVDGMRAMAEPIIPAWPT